MADNLKSKFVLLIDSGHGKNTSEKQKFSPLIESSMIIPQEFIYKGRFRECLFNRVVAKEVVDILQSYGYDARMLVTEEYEDVALSTRVARVNNICKKVGAGNVVLVSIHANANGYGNEWTSANGWEVWTTPGQNNSDILATMIYNRMKKNAPNLKMRTDYTDKDPDKESNFYIIKNANCPACLTENCFYTSKSDLLWMTSELGLQAIVRSHVEGIIDFVNYKSSK